MHSTEIITNMYPVRVCLDKPSSNVICNLFPTIVLSLVQWYVAVCQLKQYFKLSVLSIPHFLRFDGNVVVFSLNPFKVPCGAKVPGRYSFIHPKSGTMTAHISCYRQVAGYFHSRALEEFKLNSYFLSNSSKIILDEITEHSM